MYISLLIFNVYILTLTILCRVHFHADHLKGNRHGLNFMKFVKPVW